MVTDNIPSIETEAGLPARWRQAILAWAESDPRISAVYLCGSRAAGSAASDSPIDLGVVVVEDPGDSAIDCAVKFGEEIRRSLKPKLPVPLKIDFAFRGDEVLTPAMRRHGTEIYRAGSRVANEKR